MTAKKVLLITLSVLLTFINCYVGPNVRIAGGQQSSTDQFPYSVELVNVLSNGQSVCGGSLINRRYVLTAAHCYLENPDISNAYAIIGSNNLNSNDAQRISISHAIVHPGYNNSTYENDVALAVLTTDIAEASNIQYLVLSTSNPELNTNLWVAGWGITSDDATDIPLMQNYAQLYSVSASQCQTVFDIFSDTDSLCLYGNNQQPCSGDSGSAAVLQTLNNGRFVGVGLVSYGRDQCTRRQDSLNAFTSIPAYYNFIALNANLNNVPSGSGFSTLTGTLPSANATNPPQESNNVIGVNSSTQPPEREATASHAMVIIPSIALIASVLILIM